MPQYSRIGMVARWRPVHNGQLPVLRALCDGAGEALIGVGSSNRYNLRNPFTLDETLEMLTLALEGFTNYRLIPIPDLDDGPRWRLLLLETFGALDCFVTDNPYVASLLKNDYKLLRPVELVPPELRTPVDGTLVRREMARGDGWKALVPEKITAYIIKNGLDTRFRREFGLQTLSTILSDSNVS